MNRPARMALTLATLTFVMAGCSASSLFDAPPEVADCGGAFLSTNYIEPGLHLDDRVRVIAPEVDAGFRLVTETRRGEIIVVVFSNFGTKLASMRQRGERVEVDIYVKEALAIDPENLLRDLQRIHFLHVEDDTGGADIGGFRVTERSRGESFERHIVGPKHGDVATVAFDIDTSAASITRVGCEYRAHFLSNDPSPSAKPSP